jgi:tRNA-guanine family transglycosylase
MMSFDECPQFYQPYDYVKKSIERTSRWAERGLKAHLRPHDQGLFGIVQGAGLRIFVANQLMIWLWIFQDTLLGDWLLGRHMMK